ncbi:MAG TPA: hypothetical protein VFZ65_05230 [Planctomycetota bacterium]|nr:hypothetical protein [Planctomycetota bacterium]
MSLLPRLCRLVSSIAFVLVLSLPLLQTAFGFAPTFRLSGVVPAAEEAPVSLESWHSGALQESIEAQIEKSLGLRDWMVRLDNQWKFWLLGVTKRPVVAGPGGWLVEDGYLTSRTHLRGNQGTSIIGSVYALTQAQLVLAEHGVTMLLLVTPSKTETLPEHLPLPYRLVDEANHVRHIDLLRAILDSGCCNHLDAQRLFEQWRDSEPDFVLFPRSGTHWSNVAAARVAVDLLDELERLSGIDLVNLDLAPRVMGKGPAASEDDMAVLANLVDHSCLRDPMPIARTQRRPGDHGAAQGLLLVSSSFAWRLAEAMQSPDVVSPLTVYYYFKSAYDYRDGRVGEKRAIDFDPAALRAEILRYRFVVVECNVSKIPELGFGFPKAVLEAFGPPKTGFPVIARDKLDRIQRMSVPGRR